MSISMVGIALILDKSLCNVINKTLKPVCEDACVEECFHLSQRD